MRASIAVIILGFGAVMSAAAEDSWYPSKWGKDDTLGAINQIDAQSVLAATRLVKQGKRYALGMETSRNTPAYGSRTAQTFLVSSGAIFNNDGRGIGDNQVTGNDDWALLFFGVGSQIDGLGHVGINHVYYNGNHINDFFHQSGVRKFAIADLPPVVARGVVLDIVGYMKEVAPDRVMVHNGADMLKADVAINRAELEGALKRQNIALSSGDIVLIHTGYMELAEVDSEAYMAAQPGLGHEGALFLADYEPVAVGADTFGVEIGPGEVPGLALPVHTEFLAKRGIYLLENMVTRELVNDEAWEFMFVLGAARVSGTVQMIINPVAIR